MNLLQNPIQRKLSALLGAEVAFEKLSISLLGGTIDAHGMTVAGDDPDLPVLTVARVRAEVAVGKALHGEIVVKSLTIDRPVMSVVCRADGRTNLPRPPKGVTDDGADRQPPAPVPSAAAGATNEAGKGAGKWRFDAGRVLLVDGELNYRDERPAAGMGGFGVAVGRVSAELTHAGDGFDVTLVIESVRRAGQPDGQAQAAAVGPVHLAGRLAGVDDLTQLARATATATLDVGDLLHARVASASVAERRGEVDVRGDADLAPLVALIPPNAAGDLAGLLAAAPAGRVQLQVRASYNPDDGLRVPEVQFRATDVSARL